MIYISNSAYLASTGETNNNNPILAFQSVLTPSSIYASAVYGDNVAENMWSPDTGTFWGVGDVDVGEEIRITLENLDENTVNYIGIARHNLGTAKHSLVVQKSTNNIIWVTVQAETFPANDDPILFYFNDTSYKYLRLKINIDSTATAPIIAHVKLGKALVLQRRVYSGHAPAMLSKKTKKSSYGSESGQYLGQVIQRTYYTSEIKQENNKPDFVYSEVLKFINHVNGEVEIPDTAAATFFYAWRPTDHATGLLYGWTNDNIAPQITGGGTDGGWMSWGCKIEAIA